MGTIKLIFYTNEVMAKIKKAAEKRMLEATNEVRNQTLEVLSGSRSGRTYKVPGTSRTYTASAPGEAPASATGELRGSVKTAVESNKSGVTGYVGTDVDQGKMTEFGTRKMAARPWLRPSFEKSFNKVKNIFERKWF